MNRFHLFLLLMLSASQVVASPPIERFELTPESEKELGFNVKIENLPEGITASLSGPQSIGHACLPRRSGSYLFDKGGKEISVYIANLSYSVGEGPFAFGHYWDKQNKMSIFIDYICPPERVNESRRYIISSVADYYARSQSSSSDMQNSRR